MRILVFGNPLVRGDSIALRILPLLRRRFPEIEFVEFDAAENLEGQGRDLVIIDSALGIRRAVMLEGTSALSGGRACSMHDFDLALTLRLLEKMGRLDSVRIIAVPAALSEASALRQVCRLLSSSLSKNGSRSSCRGHRRG